MGAVDPRFEVRSATSVTHATRLVTRLARIHVIDDMDPPRRSAGDAQNSITLRHPQGHLKCTNTRIRRIAALRDTPSCSVHDIDDMFGRATAE